MWGGFDTTAVVDMPGESYGIQRFAVGPEDLAWGFSRKRLFLVLLKKLDGLVFTVDLQE